MLNSKTLVITLGKLFPNSAAQRPMFKSHITKVSAAQWQSQCARSAFLLFLQEVQSRKLLETQDFTFQRWGMQKRLLIKSALRSNPARENQPESAHRNLL